MEAVSKTLQGIMPRDGQRLLDEVLASYERWNQIKKQLVEYSAARGAQLRRARRKLKALLAAGAISKAELERAVRSWVEKRVIKTVQARCGQVLERELDKLLRPVFDNAANALNSLAGSVPGVGGLLTVSINLAVAKARRKLQKVLVTRSLGALDKLLKRTLEAFYGKLFRQDGRLDKTLSWLERRSKALSKLLDTVVARLEAQRRALLAKLR
jgi:hypothetical protein